MKRRHHKKKAWKATRNRVWKIHSTEIDFEEASKKRDLLLALDLSEQPFLKKHSLGPNDKPVKIKARPDRTFDIKVLAVDSEIKEETRELTS